MMRWPAADFGTVIWVRNQAYSHSAPHTVPTGIGLNFRRNACCGVKCSSVIKPLTSIGPSGRYNCFFNSARHASSRLFHSKFNMMPGSPVDHKF